MQTASKLRNTEPKAEGNDARNSEGATLPGSTSMTVYRDDYQPAPKEAPADSPSTEKPPPPLLLSRGFRVGAVAVLGSLLLGIGIGVKLPQRPARPRPAAVAPRKKVVAAATPGCLRDATQTITSGDRDQLLLDAVKGFDSGNPEQALELLRKYVPEACDRATDLALTELERQLAAKGKGP